LRTCVAESVGLLLIFDLRTGVVVVVSIWA
jgi:hypothetical protein